jgi:hypothetical protein
MTENSHQQPITPRTSRVRSATDEDLARDFGSSKLLIGVPVKPTPPGPASANSTRAKAPEWSSVSAN